MQRWTEMAAFTPVMRTHEGNRPRDNLQFDEDPEVLAHFARFTRLHHALLPLFQRLADEAVATGLPMQRPVFLHFPDDIGGYSEQRAYLLGPDLLIAPVIEAGRTDWEVRLPSGCEWVHLWSGQTYAGGQTVCVEAALGEPPVFWRAGCGDDVLFIGLALVR
jgi:alpha-glucosidase